MADDDRAQDAPQLEAPSLGLGKLFGRSRKQRPAPNDDPAPVSATPEASAAERPAVQPPSPTEPASTAPVAAQTSRDDEPTEVLGTAGRPLFVDEALADDPEPQGSQTMVEDAPVPAQRTPRGPRLVDVDGRVAASVTGLLVGLLVVVLTAGSLRLCETVRGVSSCGGGPGFGLLLAVMAAMVVLGAALLRAAKVPDPGSTSFLAVGLLCVFSLLFLVDVLDRWWMVVVIPVVAVATFLLSHWVTTAVIESD